MSTLKDSMIPLVDLRAQLAPLRAELDRAIATVIDNTAFILGPHVEAFERAFAEYIGTKHCVAVQSGTAALQLAFLGLGIGAGDEVITAPSSFFATAEAISLTGARPVFVDVEESTLNLNPKLLAAAVTQKTRAIVPVHLYGQAADLKPILEFASEKKLLVIEDACQAHGGTYGEKRLGSFGRAAAFSFYPGKNLGTIGEGGAITTDDDALAAKLRQLRDHGSKEKYRHGIVGFNYRMDGIQGAVLGVKLPHLDGWNAKRRAHAARYRRALANVGDVRFIEEKPYGIPSHHLCVVRSKSRELIFKSFDERAIARAIHYPIPIHLQEAYESLGHKRGSFPIAEAAAEEILSLPLYPELTEAQQDRVIAAVIAAFR